MKLGTKLILAILGVALLAVLAYQGYVLFHYRLHRDYQNVLSDRAEFEQGTPFTGRADPDAPAGMVLAAQSGSLKLFVNTNIAEVAVLDMRTGVMTYSNPPDAARDPIAGGTNRAVLQSQLIIEFYNSFRQPGVYNSFEFSTSPELTEKRNGDTQFEIEAITNGIRVTYTIGDFEYQYGVVPLYITPERLELFTANMTPAQAMNVNGRFNESEDAPGFLELIGAAREGTYETNATIRTLHSNFIAAGYTEADRDADNEASGIEGLVPIGFVVPLEYRLDGDVLVANIPTGQIDEKGDGRIYRIRVLPFFGAASGVKGAEEEGYMVVPNGSGSVINFNNGKIFAEDYSQYIYDVDPLLDENIVPGNSEMARLPYFGIQRTGTGRQGILAEIRSGETLADVTASISGIVGAPAGQNKPNSYNYVYSSFTLRGTISLAMFGTTGNEATLPVVEGNLTDVDIQIRYNFLTDEYEGYSGMARFIREDLTDRGILTPNNAEGDIPFYMSLLGSAAGQRRFLSVGYWGQYPMTTFAQAGEISDILASYGINNQVINYQGWFNRGYYHDVPDRIRIVRELGTRRELEELSQRVEAGGGQLFLDTSFQRVSFMSRRYNWQIETSRFYGGGMVAIRGQDCPDCYSHTASLGYIETLYNLVSPKFLGRYVDNFISAFNRINVTGISLRDLGNDLHSDRKRTEMISRQEALEIVMHSLGNLQTAAPLLISGGNAYTFGFSSSFINVPISHNAVYIVDKEIPFYQMILAGSATYAGEPINLHGAFNEEAAIIRLIEFGASPHFTFTAESSSDLKYTGKNHVFAGTFDNWSEAAIRIYSEVNAVLSRVSGSFMTEHEILNDGRRIITYDNGVVIEIDGNDVTVREVAR